MKRLLVSIVIVFSVLSLGLSPAIASLSETKPHPVRDTRDDSPEALAPASVTGTTPTSTDERFVVGGGWDLDQYLFQSDLGPDGYLNFFIPIERFYFNIRNIQDQKIRFDNGFLASDSLQYVKQKHILPEYATLRLRVWDVDEDAQGCAELDIIKINGKDIKSASGNPISLSGANQTWSTPSYQIPIDVLKFPQAKGVNSQKPRVENEIQIRVDARNCNAWAVEVDWATLEIPSPVRPVLFAHGWTGTTDTFNQIETWLAEDGIPSAGQPDLLRGIYPIKDTSGWFTGYVYQASQEFGVDKLNLIGHSKGGLVIRYALRTPKVAEHTEHVLTFATPHHGTDRAILGKPLCDINLSLNEYEEELCKIATDEFSISGVRQFNYGNYGSSGDKCENWPFVGWTNCKESYTEYLNNKSRIEFFSLAAKGDEAVAPLRSTTYPWRADTFPFPETINVNGQFDPGWNGIDGPHGRILKMKSAYQCALSLIAPQYFGSYSCPQNTMQRESLTPTATTGEQVILVTEGSLTAGGNLIIPSSLDSNAIATFELYANSQVSYTLAIPGGGTIDPSAAASDPNIDYNVAQDSDGTWLYQYMVTNPQTGTWQNIAHAEQIANVVILNAVQSAIKLVVRTDKDAYLPGEQVRIEAALSNEDIPVKPSTFAGSVIHPDDTNQVLTFYDDGSHGDATANDGIHTTQFTATATSGHANIKLTAVSGNVWRETETFVSISGQTAQYQQITYDWVEDTNGNSLSDALVIPVDINVITGGDFEVSATLVDGNGAYVAATLYSTIIESSGPLAAGVNTINLRFDGKTIFESGLNGPYQLTDLVIKDISYLSVDVDAKTNVYTTTTYAYKSFEHPAILAAGKSEMPTDLDGNGRFDFLEIFFQVDVAIAGIYEMNAHLVGPQGEDLTWGDTTEYFPTSGSYLVSILYDGYEIGEKNVDGPYTLTDLSINNTDGILPSAEFSQLYVSQAYPSNAFEGGGFTNIFLPLTMRMSSASVPPPPIYPYGQITFKSAPLAGVQVSLRYFDDTVDSLFSVTTTDIFGNYKFNAVPVLSTSDQYYYIEWDNQNSDNHQLAYWLCWTIYSSSPSPTELQCNFDVQNVELGLPVNNQTIPIPYLFTWTKRPFVTDRYEIDFSDPAFDYWWRQVGYAGYYRMTTGHPYNWQDHQFSWSVWVSGSNGYGVSYFANNVTIGGSTP